ncbi:MAG: sigma-54 dependent transcriptional regulator [Ignavibacteria bacterium]|nr:sigma-54 dependent transcriptional regulator [Ignavibacteria bacterium]
MKNKITILIVDDEAPQRITLSGHLKDLGYIIYEAESADKAIKIVKENLINIVLSDFQMPDKTGLDLFREIKRINPEIYFILFTAYGTVETAVEIMKEGAFDFLTKPINLDELELILKRIEERITLISENQALKNLLEEKYKLPNLIAFSKKMQEVINLAGRVAQSKATILIRGESGSGKEVLAKAIHYASQRKEQPFIAVNCAALNENLLESEMFGHEKGAFTGADRQKLGRFELADKGTLFLDEVGDIPLHTQVKLLRVLQEGQFERVGGTQTINTDVRIISATNKNIEELIKEGKFREDLYYRLNVITIHIPPLRERKEDIIPLIEYFLKKYSKETNKEKVEFSREAMDLLLKYNYPGNVRELENIIHHSLVISRGNLITTDDLPTNVRQSTEIKTEYYDDENLSFTERVENFEKKLVLEALKETGGNQSKAARKLGISERNLRYRLEKWGIKK